MSIADDLLPSEDSVNDARRLLRGIALETPTLSAEWLTASLGLPVVLKLENVQRTGSYKVRGAATMISRLDPERRARGVVAASAGNHAQGVALAAQRLGIPCTIVMPDDASWPKVLATRHLGAEVLLHGQSVDDSLERAEKLASEESSVLIPPFDHHDVICGQATVTAELLAAHPLLDLIVVPVGGGGLLAGAIAAARHHETRTGRRVRVVGAQAAGAAAFPASLSVGRPTRLDSVDTMADGIAVARPGDLTFAIAREHGDGFVVVDEAAVSRAITTLMEEVKQVVEPAGAVGVAALNERAVALDGASGVGVVLSGGNVDPLLLQNLILHELGQSGRYLLLEVTIRDRPGQLARMMDIVAQQRANVVEVSHQRLPPGVAVGSVAVQLSIETRGRSQQDAVVTAMRRAGYCVALLGSRESRNAE